MRISWAPAIAAALLHELFWAAIITAFNLAGHLLRHAKAPRRLRPWRAGDPLPVLLVHGYLETPQGFFFLEAELRSWGVRQVALVFQSRPLGPLEDYAALIADEVRRVLDQTRAPAVDIIAHSMGGLAARLFLRTHPEAARVRQLITLATPHRPNRLVALAPGICGRQMRAGSELRRVLGEGSWEIRRYHLLSLFGDLDPIVEPAAAHLEDPSAHLGLPLLGHGAILASSTLNRPLRRRLIHAPPPIP